MRHSAFLRVLWGLMASYLLNISVDTADQNPEHIPEDLTFNDQESIVEIIIEKVLGFEDAIAEYDDHDTEEHNKGKKSNIELVVLFSIHQGNSKNDIIEKKRKYVDYSERLTSGHGQLDTPPPKT